MPVILRRYHPDLTSGEYASACLSMGSVGDCFDNATIESLWSRMQELLNRKRWSTHVELASAIEYLEIFHNRQRRHSLSVAM